MLPDLVLPENASRLGPMAWPLLVCSVITLAICLERSVFFILNRWRIKSEFEGLCRQLEAYKYQPKLLRDEAMSLLLLQLRSRYCSGVKSLRILGALSPMIGLLGTILGIISAFNVIALHPGPVSPSLIADGLGEAMLTTAAGLLIALPALLMAHVFQALGDRQLEAMSLRLNRLSLAFAVAMTEQREGHDKVGSPHLPVDAPGADGWARSPLHKEAPFNDREESTADAARLLT
jgi:biopolymer transport protein ExbB